MNDSLEEQFRVNWEANRGFIVGLWVGGAIVLHAWLTRAPWLMELVAMWHRLTG